MPKDIRMLKYFRYNYGLINKLIMQQSMVYNSSRFCPLSYPLGSILVKIIHLIRIYRELKNLKKSNLIKEKLRVLKNMQNQIFYVQKFEYFNLCLNLIG